MKTTAAFFALLSLFANASVATDSALKCGEYELTGRPSLARQGSDPQRKGIALFPDTPNEHFVEVEGMEQLLGRRPRLRGDYTVRVRVNAVGAALPERARLLKVVGSARALQALNRGFVQRTKVKCGN